ncbi:MAG: hypothetical protein K6B18_16520 [Ruminococcus sp.]|nr:hypothetical protein [Ruminococcus sp.]
MASKILRRIAASTMTLLMCGSMIVGNVPSSIGETGHIRAAAGSINDMPDKYQSAADWIWQNRVVRENSLGSQTRRWNSLFDQIIDGKGTLNYVVRWHSERAITYEQRQKLEVVLDDCLNAWTDWLVGYENWPYQHVDVNIVGWAVADRSLLLDLHSDEVVYTDVQNYTIQPGESKNIPTVMASAPSSLSRFDHFSDENYQYPGGLDKRFDMYIWATQGFPDIGGCGGDWGQRLSDKYYLGLADGTTTPHVQIHELGHGFGFTDFYGGEGEADGYPPGGFPVSGKGSIMMAGSSSTITDFDGWFMRYTWSKIKDESGRFDLKNAQPSTVSAEFTDKISAIDIKSNGYSTITFVNNGTYRFRANGYYDSENENLAFYEVGDKVNIRFKFNAADGEIKEIEYIDLITSPVYPVITNIGYSERYHQIRFTWNTVDGASNYGVAVYLAGKWRIQTQSISASVNSYTTPKNLTAGMTYKVAIAAKVKGEWTVSESIKHAVTVTVK